MTPSVSRHFHVHKITSDTCSSRAQGLRIPDCNSWSLGYVGYEVNGIPTPTSNLTFGRIGALNLTPPIYILGDEEYDEDLINWEASTPRSTLTSVLTH